MQAALYFPYINVPASAWWTRTMLYWDQVGTIVPDSFRAEPEQFDEYTLRLVREEMVQQFFPHHARTLRQNFERFLGRLEPAELERRRRRFAEGRVARIHQDKWVLYDSGVRTVRAMGLARERGYQWLLVESTTAAEFMAALALAICADVSDPERGRSPAKWVPATDTPGAFDVLLTGLQAVDPAEAGPVDLRVRGEIQAARVRTSLLADLLPVPVDPLPVDQIRRFRERHGALLPALRRYLEAKVDEALAIDDAVRRQRLLDRLSEEVEERVEQAERYLRELPLRRVTRSPLLKMLKVVPLLKDPIEVLQDVAGNSNFEAEPLAYLAFARAAFAPAPAYEPAPAGIPLVTNF